MSDDIPVDRRCEKCEERKKAWWTIYATHDGDKCPNCGDEADFKIDIHGCCPKCVAAILQRFGIVAKAVTKPRRRRRTRKEIEAAKEGAAEQ